MNTSPAPPANILDYRFIDLQAQMGLWRQPRFRAQQVWQWIYTQYAVDFGEMTNLPRALRERLAQFYDLNPLSPVDEQVSDDRLTRKVLFRLSTGETIESVLMAYERGHTVCVSSQVGCPVGCAFCATGQGGFSRHLSAGEIVAQPLFFARQLQARKQSVSNIVVMGMGEPLLNYEAVWQAVEAWNDPQGFGLGARRITISTAGYVPGIEMLAQEHLQVGLAVSLHAADDVLRDQLVPLNQRYPLNDLLGACRAYVAQTRRRITIEYVLLAGVNDSPAQAKALIKFLHGLKVKVNLIAFNPTPDLPFGRPADDVVLAFQEILHAARLTAMIRRSMGTDIAAACGQLAAES